MCGSGAEKPMPLDQLRHPGGRLAARRKKRVSAAERNVGYAVLAVLCAIAIFVLTRQSRFSPAVLVATQEPPLSERQQGKTVPASSELASLIPQDLPSLIPLSAVEAFGPETLSDKIDGKAELYLASGFEGMVCRSFALGADPAPRIEIAIYEMDSPHGAYAVFSGQRRAGGEPSSLANKAYFTENALFFASGSYYVEVVADQATTAVRQSLEAIGSKVLAGLPAATEKLEETALFPRKGLVRETIRLSATDAFGLEGFNDIFTAEYHLDSGEATAFLSLRSTEEDAETWARNYLKFLKDNGYGESGTEGMPTGATVLKLDDALEVVMVRGRFLAGVHEATSRKAALDLAVDLDKELQEKQK
jgi:hypothetical protein